MSQPPNSFQVPRKKPRNDLDAPPAQHRFRQEQQQEDNTRCHGSYGAGHNRHHGSHRPGGGNHHPRAHHGGHQWPRDGNRPTHQNRGGHGQGHAQHNQKKHGREQQAPNRHGGNRGTLGLNQDRLPEEESSRAANRVDPDITKQDFEQLDFKAKIDHQLHEARVEGCPEDAITLQDTQSHWEKKQNACTAAWEMLSAEIEEQFKPHPDAVDKDYSSDEGEIISPKTRCQDRVRQVLRALPYNLVFNMGFWADASTDLVNRTWCPVSNCMTMWKRHHGLLDCSCSSNYKRGTPEALVQHLKDVNCIVHRTIFVYVKSLYGNHHGMGIDHRALYPLNSPEHAKAVRMENAKQERIKEDYERKLKALQEQNERFERLQMLQKADPERGDQVKELQETFSRLSIDLVKEEAKVDDKELERCRDQLGFAIDSIQLGNAIEMDEDYDMVKDPNVEIEIPQPFSLQHVLDSMYHNHCGAEKKDKNTKHFPLFASLTNNDFANDDIAMMVEPWKINVADFDYDSDFKDDEKDSAIDAGGATRHFYSKFFEQLRDLYVSVEPMSNVKMEVIHCDDQKATQPLEDPKSAVYLFGRDGNDDCIAVTDEMLAVKINAATSDDGERDALQEKAEAYYRAVGIVMFRAIICRKEQIHIPSPALPKLMRNIIFRGILPTDEDYLFQDLLIHASAIFPHILPDNKGNYTLADLAQHASALDVTFEEEDREESMIRKIVLHRAFQSRQKSTKALQNGFTLDGRLDFRKLFRNMPLDAVTRLVFSKPSVKIDDIRERLTLKHSVIAGDSKELKEDQRVIFEWMKTTFLEEMAVKGLLNEFLQFCTGYSSIPYRQPNGRDLKIEVEFDDEMELAAGWYVRVHSCTCQLLLAALLKEDDIEHLEKILHEYVKTLYDQFNMA